MATATKIKCIPPMVIIFLIFIPVLTVSADSEKECRATSDAYFDTMTGHRYVKNADGTYSEYSKKDGFSEPGFQTLSPCWFQENIPVKSVKVVFWCMKKWTRAGFNV